MEYIKGIDIFGHQVKIKADKENKTFKTYCGAFATMIYLAMIVFFFYVGIDS